MESEVLVPKVAVGPQLGEVLKRTQQLLSTLKVKQAALVKRSASRSPQRGAYLSPARSTAPPGSPSPRGGRVRVPDENASVATEEQDGGVDVVELAGGWLSPARSPRRDRVHTTQPSPSLMKLYNLTLHRDDPDAEVLQREKQLDLLAPAVERERAEQGIPPPSPRDKLDVISLFGEVPPGVGLEGQPSPPRGAKSRLHTPTPGGSPRSTACSPRAIPALKRESVAEKLSYLRVHDKLELPATRTSSVCIDGDGDMNRHTSVSCPMPPLSPRRLAAEARPAVTPADHGPLSQHPLMIAMDLGETGTPAAPDPMRRLENRVLGDWVLMGEQYGHSDDIAKAAAQNDEAYVRMKRGYLKYLVDTALGKSPDIPDFSATQPLSSPTKSVHSGAQAPAPPGDGAAALGGTGGEREGSVAGSQRSAFSHRTCSTLYTEHERDLAGELVDMDKRLADILARPRPKIHYDPTEWRRNPQPSWNQKTYVGMFRKWGIHNPPPHQNDVLYALNEMAKWCGGEETADKTTSFTADDSSYRFPCD